jgi:hypothetical protein
MGGYGLPVKKEHRLAAHFESNIGDDFGLETVKNECRAMSTRNCVADIGVGQWPPVSVRDAGQGARPAGDQAAITARASFAIVSSPSWSATHEWSILS